MKFNIALIFEYFFQLVFYLKKSENKDMINFLFYFLATNQTWRPSEGFIYLLLLIGAFLIAGVALSIFTFYEDCYWGDKEYRRYLKEGKKTSAKV